MYDVEVGRDESVDEFCFYCFMVGESRFVRFVLRRRVSMMFM